MNRTKTCSLVVPAILWGICSIVYITMPIFAVYAQDHSIPRTIDTARPVAIQPLTIPLYESSGRKLPLFLELTTTPEYFKSIIFQSTGASPYFFMPREVDDIDLAAPWKLQLARENEHRTLYTILGTVQAGGVAYLAYKHIQKHGFK